MNYRHAYHAGNFADCIKHAVMALIITHLKAKPSPFRVIDTHAGAGRYDLTAAESARTGEWQGGIGRILASPPAGEVAGLLAPFLDTVLAENASVIAGGHRPVRYPGSPCIARALLRPGDRLVVNELHPEDAATLKALFARDGQTSVLTLDAYMALRALLPPKERRGLVLIDPPFEAPDEFAQLVAGLETALQRFATGTYLIWYPVKDTRALLAFHAAILTLGHANAARLEFSIRAPADPRALTACGLIVLNPPFTLADRLRAVMPYLCGTLQAGPGARWQYGPLQS